MIQRMVLNLFFIFTIMLNIALAQEPTVENITAEKERAKWDGNAELLAKVAEIVRLSRRSTQELYAAEMRMEKLISENYDPDIRTMLNAVQETIKERVARSQMDLAVFFLERKGANLGAKKRLEEIVEKYPNYSHLDKALYLLGVLEIKSGHIPEAEIAFDKLLTQFNRSDYSSKAKWRLKSLRSRRAKKALIK